MFFSNNWQTIVIDGLEANENYEIYVKANTSSPKVGKSDTVYETTFEQLNIPRYINELKHTVTYEWLAPNHGQVKRHQLEYFERYKFSSFFLFWATK